MWEVSHNSQLLKPAVVVNFSIAVGIMLGEQDLARNWPAVGCQTSEGPLGLISAAEVEVPIAIQPDTWSAAGDAEDQGD